jgi:hypothetical protein
MSDSDVFGVLNPEDGEVGYCTVLGMAGEVFALVVYRGSEGLDGLLRMQTGRVRPGVEMLHVQRCLMASYDDRADLHPPDLGVIKGLGLKFRGPNAWPMFRSLIPGFHPWFLTGTEARFLATALGQASLVCRRLLQEPDALVPPRKGQYLVRTGAGEGDQVVWTDQWLEPAPVARSLEICRVLDPERVACLRRLVRRVDAVVETDLFLAPAPVQERKGERPFYPYMSLWVDHESGAVLHVQLSEHADSEGEFQGAFLDLIEKNGGAVPKRVLVSSEGAKRILEPLSRELGFRLERSPRLRHLEEARQAMSLSPGFS